MAIVFDCPHCKEPYKLKDELAGRKATCKNPGCRKQITIPVLPSGEELEAAALSALSDETLKQEEKEETAPAEKGIQVTCNYCGHNWTEPMSKAGKNALCPNPECRQRIRVPEPKLDKPLDWRQQNTKLPSLAKQDRPQLEGVQDAAEAKVVSGESLREAGATGIEYEPRPLKRTLMFVALGLVLVGGVALGIYYLVNRNTEKGDDQLMADARNEFAGESGVSKELTPAELPLCSALMKLAEAEYSLRKNSEPKLNEAFELYGKAVSDVQRAPMTPTRNAILAELALALTAFGGNDDEVKAQTRFRWVPNTSSHNLGTGQRSHTIHETIVRPLQLIAGTEFDFKIAVARRLTRELARKGQAAFAADILPLALFNEVEQRDEARAVIALEIHRVDKGSDAPRRIANDLKTKIDAERNTKNPSIKGNPFPVSTQTLCSAVGVEFKLLVSPPAATVGLSEATRIAHVEKILLENPSNVDEAVKLAMRGTGNDAPSQLRVLVLCAEWASDPGPALEAALALVNAKGKQTLSHYNILRFVQIAAITGKHQQAKDLADSIADEGLRAWAHGDAARHRVLASPKEKADEGWFEVPNTSDKLRAGHAWGRLWIERQNAKLSGSRSDEKKTVAGWSPAPLRAFGLAGIALGLQDR